MNSTSPAEILQFWFEELEPKDWWVKSESLDATIRERFGKVHASASRGELFRWRETAQGRLAEIIVLDQFSRNLFRGSSRSFATDSTALVLAQEAVRSSVDRELEAQKRCFLYMPYMHSESRLVHEESIRLFTELNLESNLKYAYDHKKIIDRFGRYPHRNEVLGRQSTEEEIEFLKEPGSSF